LIHFYKRQMRKFEKMSFVGAGLMYLLEE